MNEEPTAGPSRTDFRKSRKEITNKKNPIAESMTTEKQTATLGAEELH